MRTSLCLFFAMALLGAREVANAQDAVISGTTSFIEGGKYHFLDGVEITVYRKSPVTGGKSQGGGKFQLSFPAGTPVFVLFRGPNGQLPALQALKAENATKHDVHVTLYTADEAQRLGINRYNYIRAIIQLLEAAGVASNDPAIQALRELANRFG